MSKQPLLAGIAVLTLATSAFADTDLAVTGLDARDRARGDFISPTAGHEISLWVDIENRSAENALDVPLVCRRATDPNNPPQSESTIRTGALAARARRTLKVRLTASAQGGTNYFSCMVDPANQLRESNETNNLLAETLRIEVVRPNDFQIELSDFEAWTVGAHTHRAMPLDVGNISYRGPALPAPASGQAMLWQANCFIVQASWAHVREVGNMTHYPSGPLPAPGAVSSASFWLFPVQLSGRPDPRTLPAKLTLSCQLTVGIFQQGPVVHRGEDIPRADWMPVQVFWTGMKNYEIPNPDSNAYVPPQDVSMASVSGSASATADVPPQSTRDTFARFTARMTRAVPSLAVNCRVLRGSTEVATRTIVFNTTGLALSNAIDLGVLPADSYRLECKADPANLVPDDNRNNNTRSASIRVYPPGVDLAIRGIDARDQGRFGFITPSVGREIGVWVEVENTTGEDAPDVAIVCRRSAAANGPVLSEAQVRTGVIAHASRKTFTVRLPAVAQAATQQMWCMVDGGNFLRELDENNNVMAEPFTIEANQANDFSIELRDFQPWVSASTGHKSAAVTVRNPSARSAALPPPPGSPQELLWQADCQVIQMPWVHVREVGNMTHYPSGALPAPGAAIRDSMWLFPVNLSGTPPASTLAPTLNIQCTVMVGLFVQGPVVHRGEDIPRQDWMPQQVWWRGTVMAALPNPESIRRP